MNLSAVILAGGESRRMGQDKAWLKVGGESLLAHAVSTVRDSGIEEMFISVAWSNVNVPLGISPTLACVNMPLGHSPYRGRISAASRIGTVLQMLPHPGPRSVNSELKPQEIAS